MNIVKVPDGDLAVYSFGSGPPVILLHGGPGDTHDYMKRMAGPLFNQFQCIFFDQRGTGGSSNFLREQDQFTVEKMLSDLMAVTSHFGVKMPALVGHSWGAMYALFACIRFPEAFRKAALVSMGPLDAEMGEKTGEHLLSALNDQEKAEWTWLRAQRNEARDSGDIKSVNEIDHRLMQLRVKAWVFKPELRDAFLNEYFLDPPPDREVNKWVWSDAATWFEWSSLKKVQADLWVCTGADDSVPLSQTQRIASDSPTASTAIVKDCGHIPWLEHPERFYSELRTFLTP